MSQIRSAIFAGALMTSLSLSGCGDENSRAVFHSESSKHPTGWTTGHRTSAQANPGDCRECHGENFDGGISKVSCMSPALDGFRCHATNPIESPTECVSCHGGAPAGPYGNNSTTTAPNRKFAHAKHTALTGCDSCHLNAGSGSSTHAKATAAGGYNEATVKFNGFNAKSAIASYDAISGTCSGISCHGGQATPSWRTGTISISADCNKCHELGTAPATPQYNSYYSGTKAGRNLHDLHINTTIFTIVCTDCHNIGILNDYRQHFSGIITNSFTAPGNTVGNKGATLPTKIGTYSVTTQTCGTIACHPDTTWTQP